MLRSIYTFVKWIKLGDVRSFMSAIIVGRIYVQWRYNDQNMDHIIVWIMSIIIR